MSELLYTGPLYESETIAQLELVKDAAQPFMEPRLPYHNWDGHVLYSFDFAMDRCDAYEESGVAIDRLMVGCAVLFHDAGIAHDRPAEFETNEAYSADIATKVLSAFGFGNDFIQGVRSCILATHLDASPETNEQKLTCMADIANVFGSYPGFIVNSFRYYAESLQDEETLSFRDYRRTAKSILSTYLSKDLVIDPTIDCDPFGKPVYMLDGFKNIDRFGRASSKQLKAAIKFMGGTALDLLPLVPGPIKREVLSWLGETEQTEEETIDQAVS